MSIECSDDVLSMLVAATSFLVAATAWLRQQFREKEAARAAYVRGRMDQGNG